jgi:para-nitrobenzyl esterase
MQFKSSAISQLARMGVILAISSSGFYGHLANAREIHLQPYAKGVVQETAYGKVKGAEVNGGKALLWQGIPYAKAPSGQKRWKSPESPGIWNNTFDATRTPQVCLQFVGGKILGSEDCLNLDIYRPNSDAKNLPVLVHIHGGNNQTGTSKEFNAENFVVSANAIVVSINYRLGVLGFNSQPALKSGNPAEDSGNYTLLDISESLTWVKKNIASFGGNPDNITVSGFSAGGRDVMAMLISPIFSGQFHKAISLSGGMTVADSGDSTRLIAKAIAPLVVEDKVKGTEEEAYHWLLTSEPAVKDYLNTLSGSRLAKLMTNAGIRMVVFPHLFNDGTVLPYDGFETKRYNAVPLMMVTGSQEFSLFARRDKEFSGLKDAELIGNAEKYKQYQFANNYGSQLYGLFNAQESAEKMIGKYKAPIYTVDIDWGNNPNAVGDVMAKLYGSFHGIWIPLLTGKNGGLAASFPNSFSDPGAKDLSAKFVGYVSNFLWTGNPNGKGLTPWTPWTSAKNGPTQLLLNADLERAKILMSKERVRYEDVLREMDADTTIPKADKERLIRNVLSGRWFSRKLDLHYGNQNPWVQVD